jgi:N-formylmaleamate deformylase
VQVPRTNVTPAEIRKTLRWRCFVLTPPNPDYKQLVIAIDVPSLLVFDDKGVVSSVVAEEVRRLNPRFRVEQIPEAGHGLHYDQPERFAVVVKSFLRSIGAVTNP